MITGPARDWDIRGRCPMGCGETLFRGAGGYITCSYVKCPNPDTMAAVDALLAEAATLREALRAAQHWKQDYNEALNVIDAALASSAQETT